MICSLIASLFNSTFSFSMEFVKIAQAAEVPEKLVEVFGVLTNTSNYTIKKGQSKDNLFIFGI